MVAAGARAPSRTRAAVRAWLGRRTDVVRAGHAPRPGGGGAMEPTAAPWARGPIDGTPRPPPTCDRSMAPPPASGASQLPPSAIRPGTPFTGGGAGRVAAAGEPEPEAPPVAPGSYCVPRKAIATPMDVTRYCASDTYAATLQFARELQAAARGRQLRQKVAMSPMCTQTVAMLGQMEAWVEDIPPHEQAMRFGNRAFKDWHAKLVAELPALMAELLACDGPEGLSDAAVELGPYLISSFGDPQRIDYGTGHEAMFASWMLAMLRVGGFVPEDMPALALRLFPAYLQLMRKLQLTYKLEPAGSHGVWGLDDYHFYPFLIGAAQLCGHDSLRPSSIGDTRLLEEHYEDYLYFEGIRFIGKVKTGPFFEHSPILNDIATSVPSWEKVASGMIKMYEAEVLQKFPVVQHFLFGSILRAP